MFSRDPNPYIGCFAVMVEAWFCENSHEERHELSVSAKGCVSLEQLRILGIFYKKLPTHDLTSLNQIAINRKYNYQKEVVLSKSTSPKEEFDRYFQEHMHEGEVVNFILEGSAYYDVRDGGDHWIRIKVTKGDLLILPAGIYHRFCLETEGHMKAIQLSRKNDEWPLILRPAESNPHRKNYVEKVSFNSISLLR